MSDQQTRLKRIYFRSVHRGSKEMDIVLGHFAANKLAALSAPLLDIYEKLLDEDDADIWGWLIGKPMPAEYQDVLGIVRLCQLEAASHP